MTEYPYIVFSLYMTRDEYEIVLRFKSFTLTWVLLRARQSFFSSPFVSPLTLYYLTISTVMEVLLHLFILLILLFSFSVQRSVYYTITGILRALRGPYAMPWSSESYNRAMKQLNAYQELFNGESHVEIEEKNLR